MTVTSLLRMSERNFTGVHRGDVWEEGASQGLRGIHGAEGDARGLRGQRGMHGG